MRRRMAAEAGTGSASLYSLVETFPAGKKESVCDYYHRILPFYDLELADRGDDRLWTWAASSPAGCRVLELGAGTGRATAFFARIAARVVAVDLSTELLAVARRRLAGHPNVFFFAGDIREIELRERFDLVAAVDDPLVHLIRGRDRDRAFRTAARHLAPGGRFLLDAAWFSLKKRRAASRPQGHTSNRLAPNGLAPNGLEVRQTWRCDRATRQCTARFEYRLAGELAGEASFPARLWSLAELERRCRKAGLEITALWGSYDRQPWARRTSGRLIAEMRTVKAIARPAGALRYRLG